MEIERPHAELLESFSARRFQYPSTGLHIDRQWHTACIWMACFAEPMTSDPSACVTFVFISPCSNGSIDPGDKNACGVMKDKGKGTSWMLDWALNVFQQPLIDIRDARWVDGRAPPVSGGIASPKCRELPERSLPHYWLAADSSSPAVPGWGSPGGEEWHPLKLHHFVEHAHRLCDISQVSAYNKGPALSERPTWCLWPFRNWTWSTNPPTTKPCADSVSAKSSKSTSKKMFGGRMRLTQLPLADRNRGALRVIEVSWYGNVISGVAAPKY